MSPDVIIVGAGPAGVSAALWSLALDLDACLVESAPTPGGQLHHVHFHPPELAGIETGDGPSIARAFARQLDAAGIDVRPDAVATALEPAEDAVRVRLSTGESLRAPALVVATGVRRRRLDVPGEIEFEDRGVSSSATRDRLRFAGGDVAVVGGGDAAFENALLLADVDCRVTLLVRGSVRARPEFRARVLGDPRVRVREHARVLAIEGGDRVEAVRIATAAGEERLAVAGVVVKAGVVPNTEWCRGSVALDADGFVVVDPALATSVPRVWAAGDVSRPSLPSVTVAMGQGAAAVASVRAMLRP